VVRLLLENKAKIAAKGRDGNSPLHLAAEEGHEDVVELLLEYNANIEAKSNVSTRACGRSGDDRVALA